MKPPRVEFLGQQCTPDEVRREMRELFEDGQDATLEVSAWTRYLGAEELRGDGELQRTLDKHRIEQWPGFTRDLFATLFGQDTKPNENPPIGSEWISEILQQSESLPEWQELRKMADGDPWAAGLAAGTAADKLDEAIRDKLKELPAEDPQRLADEAEALREVAGDESPVVQAAEAKAHAADQKAQAVAAELAEDDTSDRIVQALKAAAEQAGEEIQEIKAAMGGLGAGDQRGVLSKVSGTPEEIREALRKDPNLRRIAEIAGQMRISAKAKQRKKVRYVPEQIVDVTVGGEISRLLPSELMRFADPTMELDLLRRLSENGALQYDLQGSEKEERGPIVMAVDASGSMSGAPFQFAMGVSLALLELALTQKRPFLFFTFDVSPNQVFRITQPGQLTLEILHEMLQGQFSGGGTSITAAVDFASAQMGQGSFEKADLILVTDGYDSWGHAMDQFRQTVPGSSIYGVAINTRFSEEAQRQLNGYAELSQEEVNGCQTAKVEVVFGV